LLRQVQPSGETSPEGDVSDQQEPGQLLRIRLLLASGEYSEALARSHPLLQRTEAEKRLGRAIEILILQAMALQGMREITRALTTLELALALAQPERFVRIFLDEGMALAKLIFQASAHGLDGGFTARLLPAFDVSSGAPSHPAQALIEPLTEREIEVLGLIESGCANQEIAAKLFISVPTVKRHISNIYAKLGAKNRTQAVSLARELGFFEK
jgi:LuxR family maltose regulon positive regulatory protein